MATQRQSTFPIPHGVAGSARSGECEILPLPDSLEHRVVPAAEAESARWDSGHTTRRDPLLVVKPKTTREVQDLIKWANSAKVRVVARGQGKATDGQSCAEGAVLVDLSGLDSIQWLSAGVRVGAGALWSTVAARTLDRGLQPPTLTGFLGLSVGGTLSMGGISSNHNAGPQTAHVKRLVVVTGEGELVSCSEQDRADLFRAVLGGLGQFAVIVGADLELKTAPERTIVGRLRYRNPASFFSAMRLLLDRDEASEVYNAGQPNSHGGFDYVLVVAVHGTQPTSEELALVLREVPEPDAFETLESTFRDYAFRVDPIIDEFVAQGRWNQVMHPWFDVWIDDEHVENYVSRITAELSHEDVGETGFLLLFPQRLENFSSTNLVVPRTGEWIFLFDILTAADSPGFNAAYDAKMRRRNREFFDEAQLLGGVRYPIGTLDFTAGDWRAHFGEGFDALRELKRATDPNGILGADRSMFGGPQRGTRDGTAKTTSR